MNATLMRTEIPGLKLSARGKVRDIYDLGRPMVLSDPAGRSEPLYLGERLLIVATDRLSAFDVVLPTPIPDKGRVLTQMSAWWFRRTARIIPNHLLSADFREIAHEVPAAAALDASAFEGRMMLVKKAKRVAAECVARGYLAGSGWKEYAKTGAVCGHALPPGLDEAQRLPEPIFTPSTKAEAGHDENISRGRLAAMVGADLAARLESVTLALYREAAKAMETCGLILADTKFEFGLLGGELILIDECLTPDSSRFWDASKYKPGSSPESFDKQFVRDYLERSRWDKTPPGPELPPDVVEGTARRYREAMRRLAAGGAAAGHGSRGKGRAARQEGAR